MSKTAKTIIWVIVIALVIWGIVSITKKSPESGPIKIGFIGALSGNAATYGESAKDGMELAIDEVNQTGGINGRQLEAIYEDGKCNGKDASTAAQKLVSIDKVKIIIGLPCSGEVLAAAPITEPAKVIMMVQGSSPDISDAGNYIFRTFPNDNGTSIELSNHIINKDGYKKVAIITENTDYAVSLQKGFTSQIEKMGGSIVESESYNADSTDFRSELLKIKNANPEALFINAQTGGNATRIAKQARDIGIKSQFYTAFFSGDEFVKSDKAVEGTIIIDAPILDSNNPDSQKFLDDYKNKFNSEPPYPFFAGGAYEETKLIADMIAKVGSTNTDDLQKALYQVKDRPSIIGNFGFDSTGDVVGIGYRFLKVENGKTISID